MRFKRPSFNNSSYDKLFGITLATIAGLFLVLVLCAYVTYRLHGLEVALLQLQADNLALKQENFELIQEITERRGYFYAVRFDEEYYFTTALGIFTFGSTAFMFIRLFVL